MSDSKSNDDDGNGPAGLGPDGTIPVTETGISVGHDPDGSNFNQEEDPDVELKDDEAAPEPE